MFEAAGRYLRRNPHEVRQAVRNAFGLRFGVPLAAFRWLAAEMVDEQRVEAVEIEARPPGLRMAGTFDLMRTRVRGGAVLHIDRVAICASEMRIELRLEEVCLVPLETKRTQISALLRAKALDLSRPGDLIANLPDMPDVIADSWGNRIIVDLMRVPKLARNARVRHAVGMLSSLITLDRMGTDDDHFELELRAFPQGLSAVVEAVGEHVMVPGVRGLRALLPAELRGELSRVVDMVAGRDPGPAKPEPDRAAA